MTLRSNISSCWVALLCTACLAAIFTFLLGVEGFGPIDDHQFINTLLQGKPFGAYVMPELGRFIPLTAQEYVLASVFMEPSPSLFHLIGGIKAVVCGVLLFACLLAIGLSLRATGVLWCVGLLSIGFANAAVRLQIGEINIFLLTLVFVGTTIWTTNREQRPQVDHKSPKLDRYAILGAAALITAFFYKELAFVFALTFASAELVRRSRQGMRPTTPAILLLLGSSITYILFYATWRAAFTSTAYSNFHADSFTHVLSLYAGNDPLIIYLVLPFTVVRAAFVLAKPARQTVYDALLAAAVAYVCAYLALRIYNTYYLLPAYGLAVCGLAGVMRAWASRTAHVILLTAAAILGANNVPQAFSDAQALKAISNNHYQFVRYLSNYLWESRAADSAPRSLLLLSVNPGNGIEIITSLRSFLGYFGTPDTAYELITTEASNNIAISGYYGAKSRPGYKPAPGDVVVYNPYQTKQTPPPALTPSLQALYSSSEIWTSPRWTFVRWVKCAVRHQTCAEQLANERRYTGYAAFRTVRVPLPVQTSPLQSPAYQLGALQLPNNWAAGKTIRLEVPVLNSGQAAWPANGDTSRPGLVHLASVWLAADGKVVQEGVRSAFYETIAAGEKAKVALVLTAPTHPGTYRLVISPIQEDVQWFYQGKNHDHSGVVVNVF